MTLACLFGKNDSDVATPQILPANRIHSLDGLSTVSIALVMAGPLNQADLALMMVAKTSIDIPIFRETIKFTLEPLGMALSMAA